MKGEFSYTLAARQLGKSSLMLRTVTELNKQGVSTVIIDLSPFGQVTVDQWYSALLHEIARGLCLSAAPDTGAWWQAHTALPAGQRFIGFLRDVVLTETKDRPIVVFVDEIDTTLRLDFTDDFFTSIRAIYNARVEEPAFKRLAFALFGVATPSDLIKDRTRTPFNIGRGISLEDFTEAEANQLRQGLKRIYPPQGEVIFDRIFQR